MSEYRHRAPQNPRQPRDFQFLEEPPGLVRRILVFILILAGITWAVGALLGCAPRQTPEQSAYPGALRFSLAAQGALCEVYPALEDGGACDIGMPQTTREAVSLARVCLAALCQEPPEGVKAYCTRSAASLAGYESILRIGKGSP